MSGYAPSEGFALTVQLTVVVHVDPAEYATAEGGLALDEGETATLEQIKADVAGGLAGFLVNEVNNCAEMPMWMEAASAQVVAEEVLT